MSCQKTLEEKAKLYEEILKKYKELEEANKDGLAQLSEAHKKIENLELELQTYRRLIFGTKREHTPIKPQYENATQLSLFEKNPEIDEEIENQVKENVEEITVHTKKKARKRKAGIKRSKLKEVEIEIKEIKLNEEEVCPECASKLKEMSKKVVRQVVEYEPPKIRLVNYVQYTYKCPKCGTEESENEKSVIIKSKLPNAIIPHTFATPSLVTEVLYKKYYLGVPLYRQEKVFDDMGLVLPRSVSANWVIKTSEYYLEPLWELMKKEIKNSSEILHCDESAPRAYSK